MATAKLYNAFGKILTRNFYSDAETAFAIVNEGSVCTILWAKGCFKNINAVTKEPLEDFQAGTFLKKDDYTYGVFEHTMVGDTETFCYHPALNNEEQIDIQKFSLNAGEKATLIVGTKLFLCSGVLNVNGTNFDKPTQVRIKTEDTVVTAITNCLGLLFP